MTVHVAIGLARPYVLAAVLAVVLAAPAGDYLHLYPPRYWRAGR